MNEGILWYDGTATRTIQDIVGTTTGRYFDYISAVLPSLLVFAVIVGILFFALRWVWSAIRGHGFRA